MEEAWQSGVFASRKPSCRVTGVLLSSRENLSLFFEIKRCARDTLHFSLYNRFERNVPLLVHLIIHSCGMEVVGIECETSELLSHHLKDHVLEFM